MINKEMAGKPGFMRREADLPGWGVPSAGRASAEAGLSEKINKQENGKRRVEAGKATLAHAA